MSTFKGLKIRLLALGLVVISNTTWAAIPSQVDGGDVQKFEQSYEEWIQSLVQSVAPKIGSTVLVEIEYGNLPEQIQSYEELKAAEHLPGLPDVLDPHFTHPSESPLASLVNRKNIRIIFEKPLTEKQDKLLKEVLHSKLKLNSAQGDHLTFDALTAGEPARKKYPLNKKQTAGGLALMALALILFSVRKKKQTPSAHKALPISVTINTMSMILRSDPKILNKIIRGQKNINLIRAVFNTPEVFSSTILQHCSPSQRRKIIYIIQQYKTKGLETINTEQTKLAQMLIAGRILQESKKNVAASIKTYANQQIQIFNLRKKAREQAQRLREVKTVHLSPKNHSEAAV